MIPSRPGSIEANFEFVRAGAGTKVLTIVYVALLADPNTRLLPVNVPAEQLHAPAVCAYVPEVTMAPVIAGAPLVPVIVVGPVAVNVKLLVVATPPPEFTTDFTKVSLGLSLLLIEQLAV